LINGELDNKKIYVLEKNLEQVATEMINQIGYIDIAKVVIHNIKSKYPMNMITVISDLGSEFKEVVEQYLESENIKQFYNDPNSVSAKTYMAIH
jgi:DNA-directed RNA polymerase delta subunit